MRAVLCRATILICTQRQESTGFLVVIPIPASSNNFVTAATAFSQLLPTNTSDLAAPVSYGKPCGNSALLQDGVIATLSEEHGAPKCDCCIRPLKPIFTIPPRTNTLTESRRRLLANSISAKYAQPCSRVASIQRAGPAKNTNTHLRHGSELHVQQHQTISMQHARANDIQQ
jgi:hypothetical protein